MTKFSLDSYTYIDGEKVYTTGSELALLAEWRRRGRLATLRGYLQAARMRFDWNRLNGSIIIDACCRHIAALEQEVPPEPRRRPFIY